MKQFEELEVRPFNENLLEKLIERAVPLPEGDKYHLDLCALYNDSDENLLVDELCRYQFMEKSYTEGEVQLTYMIPVRVKKKQEDGTFKMRTDKPDFYYPFSRKYFGAYTNEAVPLAKYMLGHPQYVPVPEQRIIKNKRIFLALINLSQ